MIMMMRADGLNDYGSARRTAAETAALQSAGREESPGKRKHPVTALGARWVRLLVLGTLGHDGRPKPCAQILGQFVELGIAVDFDGLSSGIADHVAVVAPRQMIVEFGLGPGVQRAIEIVGQLVKKLRTLHWSPSPLARF